MNFNIELRRHRYDMTAKFVEVWFGLHFVKFLNNGTATDFDFKCFSFRKYEKFILECEYIMYTRNFAELDR